MPTIDEMKAAVTAYAAAHTAGDIDGVVAVFDPQAVLADPVDQPAIVGHDAIREFFAGTDVKSNFLCNLGYGDPTRLHPRLPRFSFEEMARIL